MKPTTMDHTEQLEREADLARKRLMNTVDELDARKHQLESARLLPLALAMLGGVALLSGVFGRVSAWSRRRRRRRALRRFARAIHLR
jgi:hypothetical protein